MGHSISRKSHALSSSCNIDHFVVQLILRLRHIGSRDVLHTLKRKCVTALNSACDKYVAELDETLSRDDFDAAATLLAHCKEMLLHLEDWCLFAANKGKLKAGVHRKVRSHTKANAERALEAICDKRFDSARAPRCDSAQLRARAAAHPHQ